MKKKKLKARQNGTIVIWFLRGIEVRGPLTHCITIYIVYQGMNNKADQFGYSGTELELFLHALNWKKRTKKEVSPYINGKVLEVGAGIGGTTKTLGCEKIESWTCLEPDENLLNVLESDSQINKEKM